MNDREKFSKECKEEIDTQGKSEELKALTTQWLNVANNHKYSYHFEYLGLPIIQYPQDIIAMQELIWHVKPDLIIETGVARGGSLIFSASMLAMLDYADAVNTNTPLNPATSKRKVIGIDIDIRDHNKQAIEAHPLSHKIELLEGSSISKPLITDVVQKAEAYETVLVCLDSNHTHDHVLAELNAYSKLVTKDSYLVVFDTVIEYLPDAQFPNRTWGVGNNPKTAVDQFLKDAPEFEIDYAIDNKLQISVATGGYLKRVRQS